MIWIDENGRLPGLGHVESFHIALPDRAASCDRRFPLVLFLHDCGRDGTQILRETLLESIVERSGAAILMPDGLCSCFVDNRFGPKWGKYIHEGLIPFVRQNFPVNGELYALGFGTGGYAAARLLEDETLGVRAASAIGGNPELPQDYAEGRVPIPALAAVFGERDGEDWRVYLLGDRARRATAWLNEIAGETKTDCAMRAVMGMIAQNRGEEV